MELSKKSIWFYLLSLLVLGAGSFLITENFHKEQVKIWDEASSAKNAIEMLAQKSLIVQYEDGKPVRDDFKPPLSLWLKMICYKTFGINEFSVRLPSIVAALLTMLLLWFYGAFILKKPLLGILSALFLVLSRGYVSYHVTRTGDPDSLLIFFVTCSIISYFELIRIYPNKSKKYLLLFGISVLLSIYTKGIMGIAPLAGLAIFTIIEPNGRKLLADYKLYLTIISVLAIVSIYYIAREIVDPGYFKGVLEYELFVVNKYPLGNPKHPEFSFYFDYVFLTGFKPFTYLLTLSIVSYFITKDSILKKLTLFSFLGMLIFILGMSLSVTKNEWYISPIYPFLALLASTGAYFIVTELHKIVKEKYRLLFVVSTILVLIAISWKPVKKIHQANNLYKIFVYHPEREGRFIDNCKKNIPDLLDFDVITTYHPRQIKFYKSKYSYLDGTNINIYNKIPETIIGRKVLTSDKNTILQLFKDYKVDRIFNDEFCELIQVVSKKDTLLNRKYFCDLECFSPDSSRFIDSFDSSITYFNAGFTSNIAFSGKNSAIVSESSPFNLTLSIVPNNNHQLIHATVWRNILNKNGFLVINIPDLNIFNKYQDKGITNGDWQNLNVIYLLPKNYNQQEIKIFVWNPEKDENYFDDLEVQVF
ncbi:MAG TPA: glycosyltransferase family 39 protein [Tenuifilaceae bacterium]|nr:glycosyltransferase family 39 protein [Tenuifilaceae bacterium]